MKRQRRKFTGAEKVALLRRHLVEGVAISQVCEEAGLQPTQFYGWQKQFFENGAAAFAASSKQPDPAHKRIAELEAKLQRKNEVLGELMEEHVALKRGSWANNGVRDASQWQACYLGIDQETRMEAMPL